MIAATSEQATDAHVASAWLARNKAEYWIRSAMSALAQHGPGDLARDVVSVACEYVGDALESGADTLAREFIRVIALSLDPAERLEMEREFGKPAIGT